MDLRYPLVTWAGFVNVLFVLFFVFHVGEGANPRISTFYIQKHTQGQHTVALNDPDFERPPVSCTFSYNTKKIGVEVPTGTKSKEFPPVEDVINGILEKYTSPRCFDFNSGWLYKVCLGESILQSFPGTDTKFNLGKYAGIDKSDPANTKLIYNGGDVCVPEGARTAHILFSCGDEIRVVGISEPKTCQYLIQMMIPDVCGHPAFPSQAIVIEDNAGEEEGWFLELSELLDSTILCTAQHSGIGKIDPSFYFESFSLQFDSEAPSEYKARRFNRIQVERNEIEKLSGGIQSSLNFEHTLNYVSISSE